MCVCVCLFYIDCAHLNFYINDEDVQIRFTSKTRNTECMRHSKTGTKPAVVSVKLFSILVF